MQRIWKTAKKILFPGWKIALPLAAVSAGALVYVFVCGLQESPVAYAVYPVSFYALIAFTEAEFAPAGRSGGSSAPSRWWSAGGETAISACTGDLPFPFWSIYAMLD